MPHTDIHMPTSAESVERLQLEISGVRATEPAAQLQGCIYCCSPIDGDPASE